MDAVEFEALLHDVDTKLDRLKALYEQWFQGMERLEPAIARKELDRRVALLRKEVPRSTALRFRFQQFVMRYTTLQTYWGRIARQIEEGTYRRDLLKARNAMLASRGARKTTTPEHAFDIEVEIDAVEEAFDANAAQPVKPHALRSDAQAPATTAAPPPLVSPIAPPPAAQRPLVSPVAPPPAAPPGATAAAPRLVSPFARAATRAPGAPTQLPPSPAMPAAPAIPGAPRMPSPAAPPTAKAAPPAAPVMATFARSSMVPAAAPATPQASAPIPSATVARPAAPRPAAPQPTAPAESLSDQDVRRVYERYAEARRKNNEPSVSFDAVAKNLRDAAPKMREKYGKPVDFEVVVKDGKVGLKPVPKG